MKASLLLTFLIFAATTLHAQFEGEIIYKNKYESRLPAVSDDQLTAMLGTETQYYIKGGNYKTVTNGSVLQWQLYVNKDNKLYNKFAMSESLLWNDCSIDKDVPVKTEIKRKVVKILGYECDEIILKGEKVTQKHYFNSKLKIDAKAFAKNKIYSFDKYVELTHAIPLKSIVELEQFTLETEAVEVKPMKLDDKFFELPPNAETAPSPY